MKTLIVNSYHADWTPKIEPVKELVAPCSECEVIDDIDVGPGFDVTGFRAVVLSGSPNLISKNQYVPRYLQFLLGLRLPTLGICFGHQLLARAFGARVLCGEKFIEGYDTVRIIEHEPLFKGLPEEIIVMESHREYVALDDLARAGLDLQANSSTCAVEAFHHTSRPLFGVQFHIERSGEIGARIMENFCKFAAEYRGEEYRDD
jgi:GMP synthase (glutamine-hydrolysing)